jgi:hypothetical protein
VELYSITKTNEILSLAGKWMELESIILSEVSHAQKAKLVCSPSYVDYIPKTSAVMLLNMGHTQGENTYRRNREREGNLKLESS